MQGNHLDCTHMLMLWIEDSRTIMGQLIYFFLISSPAIKDIFLMSRTLFRSNSGPWHLAKLLDTWARSQAKEDEVIHFSNTTMGQLICFFLTSSGGYLLEVKDFIANLLDTWAWSQANKDELIHFSNTLVLFQFRYSSTNSIFLLLWHTF